MSALYQGLRVSTLNILWGKIFLQGKVGRISPQREKFGNALEKWTSFWSKIAKKKPRKIVFFQKKRGLQKSPFFVTPVFFEKIFRLVSQKRERERKREGGREGWRQKNRERERERARELKGPYKKMRARENRRA